MTIRSKSKLVRFLLIAALLFPTFFVSPAAHAQDAEENFWEVRSIYTNEFGVSQPLGLAFSPRANDFLVWDSDGKVTSISLYEEPVGSFNLNETVEDPLNLAFDPSSNSLMVLNPSRAELARINASADGLPAPAARAAARFNARALGLGNAKGITFDPASGRLFTLDPQAGQILRLRPNGASGFVPAPPQINLSMADRKQLRGIAYNPQNGHLVIANPGQQKLYELSEDGEVLKTFDLSSLELTEIRNMLFAPSTDITDDPANMNLFLLDSGGQIVELALVAPMTLPSGTTLLPTTLVQIIDTSKSAWNPSAPDASGIDYWPQRGRLLIADSEVEEMSNYWAGKNVFDLTTSGNLVSTCTTFTSKPVNNSWNNFSNEPTGLAINPNNNHIFFSSDASGGRIFEIAAGPDNNYCTQDDVVTFVNTTSLYGGKDSEDVTYANNRIFVAGGVDAEVWTWDLGPNGVLGGGDDGGVTHFDTASLGITNLEGLGYNGNNSTLLLVSPKKGENYVLEVSTTGSLLRAYNLPSTSTGKMIHKEDITHAPGSANSATRNFYITDRGVDNNQDPKENDGKIWEVALN